VLTKSRGSVSAAEESVTEVRPLQSWWPGAFRVALYLTAVSAPLVIAVLVKPRTDDPFLHELGLSFALIGFTIIALQFLLSARLSWIERPFGLDMMFGFHRAMAVVAALLLVAHPFLIASNQKSWRLLLSFQLHWYVLLGKAALFLLLANVLLSLLQRRLRLPFESWRVLHDIAGVALLVCAFVHGWFVHVDMARPAMKGVWIVLGATALAAFTWHRMIRPRLQSRSYTVVAVRQQAQRVWTLEMKPPKGARAAAYLPGQFHFLTLRRGRGLPVEEHPFTISSSPTEGGLLLSTIKESGDFTATVGKTTAGDRVTVVGPYGRFSYLLHPEQKDLVFIAGGIGITPFRSMLVHMRDTGGDQSVLLMWANNTEHDIVFREEIESIAAGDRPRLKIVLVLSQSDESSHHERGHITAEMIRRHAGKRLAAKSYYVCGPPPMMRATFLALDDLLVPRERVYFERFSL
jgi:predicted ferric reductase